MARKASEKLETFLVRCARMNVSNLAEQYSTCADVVIEEEDHDSRRHALNLCRAVDAIGKAKFPMFWESVRDAAGEKVMA